MKLMAARGYSGLVSSVVFCICTMASCSFSLVHGQEPGVPVDPKVTEPEAPEAAVDRIVEQLRKVYEFCREQPCTVLPKSHYEAIRRDMEELRERLWELERQPAGSKCS